jgi:hypothetical protein
MGVENIWIVNPISRTAWIAQADGTWQSANSEFAVPGTPIYITLAEVFATFDDMQRHVEPTP